MRLPTFDGMIPTSGPIHIVADDGEEYMLITSNMDEPGAGETRAVSCDPGIEPHINKDISVKGDVLGSIIWNVEIVH